MNINARRVVAVLLSVLAPLAAAAGVEVRSSLITPNDRSTVFDFSQITLRRVNLPTPADCTSTPAKALQCQDIAVLNTLDGFNIQPRVSIPFTGPIDPVSVNSDSVFLVSLGSTRSFFGSFGDKVGINQVVWIRRPTPCTWNPTSCSSSTRARRSSSTRASPCATCPRSRTPCSARWRCRSSPTCRLRPSSRPMGR